jgi:enterobactin synthetase component D
MEKTIQLLELGDLKLRVLNLDAHQDPDFFADKLHPLEWEQSLTFKHLQRRLEFLGGRWLAHHDIPLNLPIIRSQNGEPQWPLYYRGSISHKIGTVVTAVVSSEEFEGIGIDIESTDGCPLSLEAKICQKGESKLIDHLVLANPNRGYWLSLIFAFKESIFKCHYPSGKVFFYFHDVSVVSIDAARGTILGQVKKNISMETSIGDTCLGQFKVINQGPMDFFCVATYKKISKNILPLS